MKHLLKIPQKKTKCFVSYLEKPLKLVINDIKIKNFIGVNNISCQIPIKGNEDEIKTLNEIDNVSYKTLIDNPEWTSSSNIDNIYNYSYSNDISAINLLFNDKTSCYMNGNNKDLEEIVEIMRNNRKLREININMEINFLGLFIYENSIINKWIIKIIDIEELDDDLSDWNREEIEKDWENEILTYEEDIINKIETYKQSLINVKELYNEIKKEDNYNNWEKKILKLKKNILKI
jgi:hypothetical protein